MEDPDDLCWCDLSPEQFDIRAATATPDELASAYHHLAARAAEEGRIDIALAYGYSATEHAENPAIAVLAWSLIAAAYQHEDERGRAADAASRALVYANMTKDPAFIAMAEENMGSAYMSLDPAFAAERHANAAATAATIEVDDHNGVTRNMAYAAYGDLLAGRDSEALGYAEAAIEHAESHKVFAPEEMGLAHNVAAQIYTQQRNRASSRRHRDLAAQATALILPQQTKVGFRMKIRIAATLIGDAVRDLFRR